MKKIIVLTALITAFMANAASFSWGTGTTAISFDGTTLAGNATAYLVYLGNGDTAGSASDLWTTTATAIVGADAVKTQASSTAKRTAGRVSSSYGGETGESVSNGDVYGVYVTYNDGTDTWFNFSDKTYTVSGIVLGNEMFDAPAFTFAFDKKSDVNPAVASPVAGGGWYRAVAVPEPSSAALALAGLALLLKRRKA